jgi:hypothetical protein
MKRSEVFVRIFETLETAFSHPEGNTKLATSVLEALEDLAAEHGYQFQYEKDEQ